MHKLGNGRNFVASEMTVQTSYQKRADITVLKVTGGQPIRDVIG